GKRQDRRHRVRLVRLGPRGAASRPYPGDGNPMRSWQQTFTGRAVDLINPRPEMISILDVAHHLSTLARFTGAANEPYTIAQHVCLVSQLVPFQFALHGFSHDWSEAYLNDLSSPLKRQVQLAGYRTVESNFEKVIAQRLGLTWDERIHRIVKHADLVALAT